LAEVPEYPVDLEPENTKFKHRVMILDITGNRCAPCAVMMSALRELSLTDWHNYYNEVTCHAGGMSSNDPANSPAANTLERFVGSNSWPWVTINIYGGKLQNYSDPAYTAQMAAASLAQVVKKNGADVGIAMNVVGDSENVFVAASIKGNVTNEYKVNAWLLENKIDGAGQAGAQYDYQKIYNHCVRNIAGNYSSANVLGESIGTLAAGETFNTAFQLPIVSKKWNVDNMEVIVLVSAKNAKGKWDVVNTAVCPVNQQITFEYLQ
jgi:hypothetical protein